MDFMKIIRSLEEFLYEVMTWIVFYPRTLLRVALRPIQTLRYAQAELNDSEEDQYLDSVSPPLFLMLTLMIAHGLELAARVPTPVTEGTLLASLFSSEQNLLIVRSLMFAVFPLAFATQELKLTGQELNRNTLRAPFFGQCYVAALFSLLIGSATIMTRVGDGLVQAAGVALGTAALVWYLTVQAIWFQQLFPQRRLRAVAGALLAFIQGLLTVIVASVALATIP